MASKQKTPKRTPNVETGKDAAVDPRDAEIAALKARLAATQGGSGKRGYLVTTPQKVDTVTAGVRFFGGRAFLEAIPAVEDPGAKPTDPKAAGTWKEARAAYEVYAAQQTLLADLRGFGYDVQEVEGGDAFDLIHNATPVTEDQLVKRMSAADALVQPSVMGK